MLDDGAKGIVHLGIIDSGIIEFLRQVPRGLQVDDVVIRKFFSLKLARIRDTHA